MIGLSAPSVVEMLTADSNVARRKIGKPMLPQASALILVPWALALTCVACGRPNPSAHAQIHCSLIHSLAEVVVDSHFLKGPLLKNQHSLTCLPPLHGRMPRDTYLTPNDGDLHSQHGMTHSMWERLLYHDAFLTAIGLYG